MTNDYFRYYKPNILLIFIIISATAIGAIVHALTPALNRYFHFNYYQYPSTGVLVGLLLFAINQWWWKRFPFCYLFWVKDISGRYKGYVEYRHYITQKIERKETIVEIEQSASKINVECYFTNEENSCSFSKSLIVSIIADEFGNQTLVFTYENMGNSIHNLPRHNGTNIIHIRESDKMELDGVYYTDKSPQTKGNIKCTLESKKLKRKF
jgi:hypothetical protein